MLSSSILLSPLRTDAASDQFRTHVLPSDTEAVERLVRSTGVFSAAEIAIARELVDEHLLKGAEASGYYFLFADGPNGIEGYTCYGPVPGTNGRFELYWIAVCKVSRRNGLGQRLQAASEDAVRRLGAVMMIAETSTKAEYSPARAFYVRQGYRLLADIPDWHDEGDGLAIFGKRL